MPRKMPTSTPDDIFIGYRGGKIAKADSSLFMGLVKVLSLNPKNVYDKGVLNYFKSQGESISEKNGREEITYPILAGLRLDHIINLAKLNETPLFDDEAELAKYLPGVGVGVVGVGRGDVEYITPYEFKENYDERVDELIGLLKEDEDDMEAFLEAAERRGLKLNPSDIKMSMRDKELGMEIYTDYFIHETNKLKPSAAKIDRLPYKLIDVSCLGDTGISRLKDGFFYVRTIDDVPFLVYTNPFSKTGCEAVIHDADYKIYLELMKNEQEHDRKERIFSRTASSADIEDFVTQNKDELRVSMRRNKNPKRDSPIVHLPVFNLSKKDRQAAELYLGHSQIDSGTEENILTLETKVS